MTEFDPITIITSLGTLFVLGTVAVIIYYIYSVLEG